MTDFCHTHINNALVGGVVAKSLYLGEKSLCKFDDYLRGLPELSNLVAIFASNNFTQVYNATSPEKTSLTMINYITKNKTTRNFGYLSNMDSICGRGLYNVDTQNAFSLGYTPEQCTHLACFRIATNKLAQGTAIDLVNSSEAGVYVNYASGKFTLKMGCQTSKDNCHEIPLDVDPHEYNVFAFSCFPDRIKVYVNGDCVGVKKIRNMPSTFTFRGNRTKGFETCMQTYSSYKKALDQDDVKKVTYWLKKIIPDSGYKAFEEGVALYDCGKTHDEITGGWVLHPDKTHEKTVCEMSHDCIKLNGYNQSDAVTSVGVSTTNLIDFTPYSKICFQVSSSVYPNQVEFDTTARGVLCGYSTKSDYNEAGAVNVYSADTVAGITGKVGQTIADSGIVCMDISEVSGEFSPFIIDGSGALEGKCSKVYRVWLV